VIHTGSVTEMRTDSVWIMELCGWWGQRFTR
jgi:hypothetical protein